MATASQDMITVGPAWTNIVAGNGALADVDVLIQNLAGDSIDVVAGGASAPVGKGPVRLSRLDSLRVNAGSIWVRGSGQISATVL